MLLASFANGQIVSAMNDWRIELTGFNDLGVEREKSFGLISEGHLVEIVSLRAGRGCWR